MKCSTLVCLDDLDEAKCRLYATISNSFRDLAKRNDSGLICVDKCCQLAVVQFSQFLYLGSQYVQIDQCYQLVIKRPLKFNVNCPLILAFKPTTDARSNLKIAPGFGKSSC